MELIKVPTDINDIADLSEFRSAIETINNFNQNLQKFGQKILDDKFLKTINEWKEILTPEVLELNKQEVNRFRPTFSGTTRFLFCYVRKILISYDDIFVPSTGCARRFPDKLSFSDDGTLLIIEQSWQVSKFRGVGEDFKPRKRTTTINYVTGEII